MARMYNSKAPSRRWLADERRRYVATLERVSRALLDAAREGRL